MKEEELVINIDEIKKENITIENSLYDFITIRNGSVSKISIESVSSLGSITLKNVDAKKVEINRTCSIEFVYLSDCKISNIKIENTTTAGILIEDDTEIEELHLINTNTLLLKVEENVKIKKLVIFRCCIGEEEIKSKNVGEITYSEINEILKRKTNKKVWITNNLKKILSFFFS